MVDLTRHDGGGSLCAKSQSHVEQEWIGVLPRRQSAPDLLKFSALLVGDRNFTSRSKFWAVDGEDSSEEKDEAASLVSSSSGTEFIRDALRVGFSVDEMIRAEAILSENIESPKFGSVDCGVGHVRHPRPLPSRITEKVADWRLSSKIRPWKGPLPKFDRSSVSKLGEIKVKDLRKVIHGKTGLSLNEFGRGTEEACGPTVSTGLGQLVLAQTDRRRFKFPPGLSDFFSRGGRLHSRIRISPSQKASSCDVSTHPSLAAHASSTQRAGAGGRVRGRDAGVTWGAPGARHGRVAKLAFGKGHGETEVHCDICDGNDHVNYRCPTLKLPKPVAHVVGLAVVGLGFYHIPHAPLPRKNDSKTALVKVVGGSLSSEQLVAQLERIVPGKWKWKPRVLDNESFIVQFPSKSEFQRSIAYGGADVRENGVTTGVRLQFEVWHVKEGGFLLPKVQLRVYGIHEKLREYLNLWAVGTMFGSTQMVDMKTTRKNDFGRILVAVLDPKLLPSSTDVVIGDHYFELKIKKERVGFDDNGDEVEFDFKDGEVEGNEEQEEVNPKAVPNSDSEPKGLKGDDRILEDGNDNNKSENNRPAASDSMQALEDKIKIMATNILDMAVETTLGEYADLVLAEDNNAFVEGVVEGVLPEADNEAESGLPSLSPWAHPPPVVGPKEVLPTLHGGGGALQMQGGSTVPANVLAAAAITEATITPTRSSPRNVNKDEHVLEKAKKRTAWKNLDFIKGYLQGNILDSTMVPTT